MKVKTSELTGVTEAMRKAGSDIACLLMDASIAKCMNGLGGGKSWDEWCAETVSNRDLCVAYLNEEIDSVTAIYLAMERAK